MIPHLGFGSIVTLDLGAVPIIKQYMITIGSFLDYSRPYFKEILTLLSYNDFQILLSVGSSYP
jgi:hypothetical protein